jgi:hypothetical protein
MQVQVLSSAGMLPRITLGTPGIHGAGVTGTQGTGVSTPAAAVVAVATAGFEGVMHMPNGLMLTIGTKIQDVRRRLVTRQHSIDSGVTVSDDSPGGDCHGAFQQWRR